MIDIDKYKNSGLFRDEHKLIEFYKLNKKKKRLSRLKKRIKSKKKRRQYYEKLYRNIKR